MTPPSVSPMKARRLWKNTRDAGLLAAAQAVEHYEISRYGTMRPWAEELGDAVKLLQATLDEEEKTDQDLTRLAETAVNGTAERSEAAE